MESAKKLLQFDFNADAFARRAPHTITISQDLRNLIEKIIDKHGGKDNSSTRKRRHRIYLSFINTSPRNLPKKFNTFSRVRKLARVLTYSENDQPRIVDTPQLCYALQLIESYFSPSALRGVCSALKQAPDAHYLQMLEAFVKKYQTNPKLFPSHVRLSTILLNLELPNYTHGYRYYGAVAGKYKSITKPYDKLTVADIVKFIEEKHRDDQTNNEILSELIEQLGNDASEHLRQPIQTYALQKWQTPWNTRKWKGISHKAWRIFEKWIIKKDFQFFFDGIAKGVNHSKISDRKAFWSAYLEHMTFCQPVLSRESENLFTQNQQDFQYYKDRSPATLRTHAKNQRALIIAMGNYIFVEYSTRSRCYVYNNANCPFDLNSAEYRVTELANEEQAKYQNIIHDPPGIPTWQSRLASWIATNLGIEPLRSYRLDGGTNSYTVSAKIKL